MYSGIGNCKQSSSFAQQSCIISTTTCGAKLYRTGPLTTIVKKEKKIFSLKFSKKKLNRNKYRS